MVAAAEPEARPILTTPPALGAWLDMRWDIARWEAVLRPTTGHLARQVGNEYAAVLFLIEERGPQRMSDIAGYLSCSGQTATDVIGRMEVRDGLVRRTYPPTDRRVRLVELTSEGRSRIPALHAALTALTEDSR